ncbi:MAG: OmpA family protein [Byssovorax sp.]
MGTRRTLLRPASKAALAAAALAALSAPSPAGAQTRTFSVDRLLMAGAPDDGIAVWRPEVGRDTRFFGQLGLGYALNPLRIDNFVDDLNKAEKLKGPPLSGQLVTYLDAGAEILNRATIHVSFPLVAYQTGNPTNTTDASGVKLLPQDSVDLKPVAPGDLRLEGRFIAYRNEAKTFKLAVSAGVLIPTGNKFSFAGDNGVGGTFGLAVEYNVKSFFAVFNAAYRLRPSAQLNELNVSHEVLYGLGGYVPLRKGTIRLGAELFGGIGAGSKNTGDLDTAPLEWQVNGRMYFTAQRQLYASLGAGTRLTGGYAPDFRGVALVGGSFSLSDSDPASPGFHYAFNVQDDADTDRDGIPDEIDACPADPGLLSSDPEANGCPKFIRRISGGAEIQILKQVEFEFDKSTILPVSYPILDEVVRLLQVSPEIKQVSIEGHTDNQGKPDYNQKLSEDRASSVMAYLVKKGIDPGRLTSKGFGLTKPIATNDTDEGRQRNRRVEFKITEQLAPSKPETPKAKP